MVIQVGTLFNSKIMKIFRYFILLAVLVVSCAVSYHIGSMKHYNSACRMSDLIRCYEDNLRDTSEVKIEDWGCFEELEGIFLWDDAVGPRICLEDYVYSY